MVVQPPQFRLHRYLQCQRQHTQGPAASVLLLMLDSQPALTLWLAAPCLIVAFWLTKLVILDPLLA
jgi:hypothetical protein